MCTASGPTWPSPGSRATAATCSCATSANTSTSTARPCPRRGDEALARGPGGPRGLPEPDHARAGRHATARHARQNPALCDANRRDRAGPGEPERHLLAQPHRPHLRGPVHLRPPGPARQGGAADRGQRPGGQRRLSHLHDPAAPWHLFRRRPGLQGPSARGHGGRLRLQHQALCRPGQQGAGLAQLRGVRHRRPERTARAGPQGQEALPLRHRGRGPAGAGPLHAAGQDPRAAPAADRIPVRRQRPVWRRRARGGRALRRHDFRASGRHRALRAEVLAAQLAAGVRAQPGLPPANLRGQPRARRCRGAGHLGAGLAS
mmetsp:Transcript_91071/g.253553  ORF Transcript_91071/g.253553 Transcript_91071/m.253553 type:complete len:318 (+) Transcript_91071:3192-4145(+)